jgi:outer membrane immunogenic protein
LITPSLLVYGTGGLAYGGVNFGASVFQVLTAFPAVGPGISSTAFSDTRVGWTAGGGVEWMFMPNWSAKVEYLYYDLGNVTPPGSVFVYPVVANPIGVNGATTRFDGHIVRAGVNYHFNWGAAPVVAAY